MNVRCHHQSENAKLKSTSSTHRTIHGINIILKIMKQCVNKTLQVIHIPTTPGEFENAGIQYEILKYGIITNIIMKQQ